MKTKEKNEFVRITTLGIATALIGSMVGPGFSSGNELMQFFGNFGYIGVAVLNVPHMTVLIIAIVIVFGLGTGGVYYIPWTSYTFMADVDEVVTNRRREGIYAGAMTMAGKLIRASIVSILGFTLAAFGFKEGASVQPESACNAIIGVMLFGCCGLALLGIICSGQCQSRPAQSLQIFYNRRYLKTACLP